MSNQFLDMGVFQLMLVISLSAVSRAQKCYDPWKEIEGDCWGFFGFGKGINGSWNNAKLECHRKGAVLGYPRTNAAFEDIIRETKASSEFTGWKWLKVGLHSKTDATGPYTVLENGNEPSDKIPWADGFPVNGTGFTCVFLNIGLDSPPYRPGRMGNSPCHDKWFNTGYACKEYIELRTTTTTTAKPTPRPTTTRQATGSVPRITETTPAEVPYVLIMVVVGVLVVALVTAGICCGSAVVLYFFPNADEEDATSVDSASLDSENEKKIDKVKRGKRDVKVPVIPVIGDDDDDDDDDDADVSDNEIEEESNAPSAAPDPDRMLGPFMLQM